MAFPVSPTNNQTTRVNGITYIYNSTDNAWSRLATPFGNLSANGDLIVTGNITGLYGTFTSNLSIGPGFTQQDVLNLNNNNLYGVNTIRINDPGTSEGIAWEGGSGWNIYESPNDLSNDIGNLQIVLSGTRVFTVDTNQTVNIPSTWRSTSTTTGALTVGGGVGIAGNLYVGGNISIGGNTYLINTQINNQVTGNLIVGSPLTFTALNANVQYGGNQNSYLQLLVQNANRGSAASTDFVAAADNAASDTDTYIDMGINSSTYNQAGYSATFPNDGYLYVQGNTTTGGGNLILATMTNRDIIFTTGGQNANNEVMRITSSNVVQITGSLNVLNIGDVSANVGLLYLANTSIQANLGTLFLSNASTQANLGAYQSYANSAIAAVNAFYTYANSKIGTNTNSNLVVAASTSSTSKTTGALIVTGGAGVSGNVYVDRLYSTQGLFWAGNGFAISTGGGGGGGSAAGDNGSLQFNDSGTFNGSTIIYDSATGNVVITDTTDSTSTTTGAMVVRGGVGIAGNVFAGKVYTTTGLYWAGNGLAVSGGITYTSDTAPHTTPNLGDQWYDTSTDILYEYIEDGTTSYWVDVQSPIFNGSLSTNLVGNLSITGNLSIARAITATGNITTVANLNVLRSANIYGNILGGNIFVNRDAIVSSNLTVNGYTIIANVVSSGNITTTGNISSNNITVTTTITTGNITTGNLSVSGNVNSSLTVTGNVTASNLSTSGTLSGNITTTNSLTATGNIAFSGANVSLGNVANIKITGGTNGYYLQTYGNGTVSWQSLPLTSIQEFTATGGQTVFTIVGAYTVGTVMVFVNGIQMNSADFTATDGTTVTLTAPRRAGDIVRVFSSVGASSLSSGLTLSVTNTKNFAVAMSVAMGM